MIRSNGYRKEDDSISPLKIEIQANLRFKNNYNKLLNEVVKRQEDNKDNSFTYKKHNSSSKIESYKMQLFINDSNKLNRSQTNNVLTRHIKS